jgi:hypothetical protein
MASNNINVGSAANDGEGQNLRDAFISVRKNFAQMFGITYTGDTQDLSGTTFSSDVITQGSTNKFLTSGSVGTTQLAASGVTTAKINNDAITHDKLSARFTAEVAISTLTGTVNYDYSLGSCFKLSGDITGAYTINLTNYKIGQIITIYPLKGDFGVYLTAGTGTGVFNKLAEVDYDGTVDNILQIECVDDQATTPVFFYSVATFAADATI